MTDIESEREEFYRIKRLPPYVFAEVNKLKAKLRKEGMDIILSTLDLVILIAQRPSILSINS